MLTKLQESVYRFMRFDNIRSGEFRTPLFVLYFNYVQFCNKMKIKYVSPIEFGRRMSVYFQKGKSGRYAYYLTNLEPPKKDRRRYLKMWYNRQWARMRNGKKEKR